MTLGRIASETEGGSGDTRLGTKVLDQGAKWQQLYADIVLNGAR